MKYVFSALKMPEISVIKRKRRLKKWRGQTSPIWARSALAQIQIKENSKISDLSHHSIWHPVG